MQMYVRIQVTPFILPQKLVQPCIIAPGPGLKSVKIKFYSPSSSPLSFPSPMIPSWSSSTWQWLAGRLCTTVAPGGVSTPGGLLHWDNGSSQYMSNVLIIGVHPPTCGHKKTVWYIYDAHIHIPYSIHVLATHTCTQTSLVSQVHSSCIIVTRPFFSMRVGSGDETSLCM